jgi:hypothetical protein
LKKKTEELRYVLDFNEITPSILLENNIKVKEKFCVVFVRTFTQAYISSICTFFWHPQKKAPVSAAESVAPTNESSKESKKKEKQKKKEAKEKLKQEQLNEERTKKLEEAKHKLAQEEAESKVFKVIR